MSILVPFNGVNYIIPTPGEVGWGSNLDAFFVAIGAGSLQKTGGNFTLSAPLNFGPSFGLTATTFSSGSLHTATGGVFDLANGDTINWRNAANLGNLPLGVNGLNQLTFNGIPIESNVLTSAHIFVGNASNVSTDVAMSGDVHIDNTGLTTIQSGVITGTEIASGTITDANIASGAAIAVSKLAHFGDGNRALIDDVTGAITTSVTTSTELGYVSGVTSAIQTQLNSKQATLTIGNLTDAGTDGIVVTGGTGAVIGSGTSLAQHVADASHNGYLSSTDWAAFTAGTNPFSGLTTDGVIYATSATSVASTAVGSSGQVLTSNGTGSAPTFQAVSGTGTVNAGTQYQIAYYATSTNAVSGLTLITANRALVSDANGLPIASATTATELGYSSGVTSAIQTQINTKAPAANPTFTGTIGTGLTVSRAIVTDGSGNLTASTTTATELGYVSGVTSAIQTQLGTKFDTAGTGLSQSGTTINISTVPVANGGTGQNTLAAHGVVIGEGTSGVNVTTAGTSGQVLTSNGASSDPTFQSISSGSGTVNSGTQYELAYYAATGTAVSGLALITANQVLISNVNGLPIASATTATELGYVSGVTSAIQTQLNGKQATFSGLTTDGVIYATSATAIASTAVGTSGQVLTSNGAGVAPTFQVGGASYTFSTGLTNTAGTITLTAPVTVALGGTNSTTALSNGYLMYSNAGKIVESGIQVQGGDAITNLVALESYAALNNTVPPTAFLTLQNGEPIAWLKASHIGEYQIYLNASDQFVIQAPILSPTLITPALGTPSSLGLANATGLALTTGVTGILPVANGGTGQNTLAAHGVIIGEGTSGVNVTSAGTAGQVLTSNGASADPTFQAAGGGGGGTVNSGTQYQMAYYATTGTAVSGSSSITTNSSNQLLVTNGTAALPGYSFTSDTDIGMYYIGTDDLGFATNGVKRFEISATLIWAYLNTSIYKANATLNVSDSGVSWAQIYLNGTVSIGMTDQAGTANHWSFDSGYASSLVIDGSSNPIIFGLSGVSQLLAVFGTNGCAIRGSNLGDNALAGFVGERISASVARASAVSLSNGVAKTITSITLTAGSWDITGYGAFVVSGSGVYHASTVAFSNTTNTLPGSAVYGIPDSTGEVQLIPPDVVVTNADSMFCLVSSARIGVSTTLYLVLETAITSGTVTGYGSIAARRVR